MTAENTPTQDVIEVKQDSQSLPLDNNQVKNQVTTLSTYSARPEASQQIADQFMAFIRASLAQLTILWNKAISEEQLATLTLIGIILLSIPLLTIVIGVVNIINNIPLFSSLLELIGLGYFIWFTYRYLLFADTRRELALKTSNLKQRVIGK
jgi:threonine/homoserine/homoserine lactone efflux protein